MKWYPYDSGNLHYPIKSSHYYPIIYIYIPLWILYIYIYISPLYPHCHHVLKMAKWFQQHLQVSRHRGVHVDQDLARRACLLHQRGHRVHLGYVRDDGKWKFPGVHMMKMSEMMENIWFPGVRIGYTYGYGYYWIKYVLFLNILVRMCISLYNIIYILWYPLVLQHGT